ncbi:MAG: hypothetical protein JY451_03085 [Erythrobacter sp.]|nr:MAG: hypothetical protein JY451_03085 [Erythrobacter sp.]
MSRYFKPLPANETPYGHDQIAPPSMSEEQIRVLAVEVVQSSGKKYFVSHEKFEQCRQNIETPLTFIRGLMVAKEAKIELDMLEKAKLPRLLSQPENHKQAWAIEEEFTTDRRRYEIDYFIQNTGMKFGDKFRFIDEAKRNNIQNYVIKDSEKSVWPDENMKLKWIIRDAQIRLVHDEVKKRKEHLRLIINQNKL